MNTRKIILTVAAAAGLIAAGAGASIAANAGGIQSVKLCVVTKTRTVIQPKSGASCPAGSFLETVNKQGVAGPAGPAGAPGATGPAGLENVTVPYTTTTVTAGATASILALCAPGQTDLSGGYSVPNGSLTVLQSKPTWDGEPASDVTPVPAGDTGDTTNAYGWQVVVTNSSSSPQTVNVWANCGTLDN